MEFGRRFGTRRKEKKRVFISTGRGIISVLVPLFHSILIHQSVSDTEAVCAKQWRPVSGTAWVCLTEREDRSALQIQCGKVGINTEADQPIAARG